MLWPSDWASALPHPPKPAPAPRARRYAANQNAAQNAVVPITFKVGGTTTGYLRVVITSREVAAGDLDGLTDTSGMTGLTSHQGEQDLDGFDDDDDDDEEGDSDEERKKKKGNPLGGLMAKLGAKGGGGKKPFRVKARRAALPRACAHSTHCTPAACSRAARPPLLTRKPLRNTTPPARLSDNRRQVEKPLKDRDSDEEEEEAEAGPSSRPSLVEIGRAHV